MKYRSMGKTTGRTGGTLASNPHGLFEIPSRGTDPYPWLLGQGAGLGDGVVVLASISLGSGRRGFQI